MGAEKKSHTNKPRFVGEWVRLGDVCKVVSGATPKTGISNYWDGSIRWITPAELSEDSHWVYETARRISEEGRSSASLKMMPVGTVLLTSRAPIGKVAIAGSEMCCNQGFKNLICSDRVINEYLFWYLKFNESALQQLGHGATFKEISKKDVENINIKLLPLDLQNEAVGRLSRIETVLLTARQQVSNLDSLVKSRFVEMFGTLTPSTPIAEACIEFIDGDWIESKDQSESGIRLIQTGNIGNGVFLNKENRSRHISEQTFRELKCKEVLGGDILVSRLPDPVGRACIVPSGSERYIAAVDCSIVRLNKEWNATYFVCFTMTNEYELQIKNYLTGTTRKRISRSNLGKIKIPAPPFDLQQEFAIFVQQVDKLRFTRDHEINFRCERFTLS